jgi:predicted GIY-YIG superfamily endonuclease
MPSRLASHHAGESPHTCHHRPWRLVVSVAFASEPKAVEFEKYLKSGTGAAFLKHHFL